MNFGQIFIQSNYITDKVREKKHQSIAFNAEWQTTPAPQHPTTSTEVVNLLAKGESLAKRALLILVDGLQAISAIDLARNKC